MSTPPLFEAARCKLLLLSSTLSVLKCVSVLSSVVANFTMIVRFESEQTFAFGKAGEIVAALHLGKRLSEQFHAEL